MTEQKFFTAIKAAVHAGRAIMDVYSNDFEVEFKKDESPLTVADKSAHQIIAQLLTPTELPVLSEEGSEIDYAVRRNWNEYWLVDPLDGTKEFIKRNGDFTVNIAAINGQKPFAGIIYAPVYFLLYFAYPGIGSFRFKVDFDSWDQLREIDQLVSHSDQLPIGQLRENFVVVSSKSHRNPETEEFIHQLKSSRPVISFLEVGSSLKFCRLAEGSADIYPRLGPTMEWDTAAGHAIADIAGCKVRQFYTDQPLFYNKENLLNPSFLVEGSSY